MHPLAARVRRAVRRYDLWPRAARVAVALSGGADSVALLHLIRELEAEGDLGVAGVLHVNHGLRGEASEADEAFCRELAQACGVPVIVESVDVAAERSAAPGSLEEVARRLRYAALARGAAALNAVRIAVGHTRDDQAETVLLKLLRGAGPTGLGGIYPRRDQVVRPLLDIGRDELRSYLTGSGHAWREDATNLDPALTRNRIRHELLPLLEARFAPRVKALLARTAELSRDDASLLEDLAAAQVMEAVRVEGRATLIDRGRLRALPAALSRRVVRIALRQASGGQWAGLSEVEAVLEVAAAVRRRADLPGVGVELRGPDVVLVSTDDHPAARSFCYPLPVPGSVSVPEAACRLEADRRAGCPATEWRVSPERQAVVDAGMVGSMLAVRNWRPGDRLRPLGLGGRKKLHDLFVDRKVPRSERGRVPIVVDVQDRIVWVAGHAISDEFRVTDAAKPVVVLRLTQLSGGTI